MSKRELLHRLFLPMSQREPINQIDPGSESIVGQPREASPQPPTEPTTYTHLPLSRSPLDQIRLIRLRKYKSGPVRCEMGIFSLECAPKYRALSYRWGPPSPLHDIYIDNQKLKIRDVLNSCLLELREDVDTWLWIDQICIAQADTKERNHQVGLMSRIYSNATSVIIWLGDIPLAVPRKRDRFNNRDLDDISVMVLLGNIYFTRLWIVQEVMLAKKVRLHLNGNRRVDWSTLHDAYSKLVWEFGEPAPIPVASMFLVSYTRRGPGMRRQMTWMECINGFSANACGDPRDKVYGMMGIVKEEDRFTVDYNKSVLEVYIDMVNILKGKSTPHVIRHYLRDLGSQMGILLSFIESISPLPQRHFEDAGCKDIYSAQRLLTRFSWHKRIQRQRRSYESRSPTPRIAERRTSTEE